MLLSSEIDLSIVIATRGDNYGGDNLEKTKKIVQRINKILVKANITHEFVIVDFNVIKRNEISSLREALPENVKFIDVPHSSIEENLVRNSPFVEFLAKNIGIRRSQGNQILCINNDCIASRKAIISCVKRPELDNSFLRVNRLDMKRNVLRVWIPKTLNIRHDSDTTKSISVTYLKSLFQDNDRVLEQYEKQIGDYILGSIGGAKNHSLFGLHTNASGDFICAPKWAWHKIGGYSENKYLKFMGDSYLLAGFNQIKLNQVILKGKYRLFHLNHNKTIDHRFGWTQEKWLEFLKDFREVCQGINHYDSNINSWGMPELDGY